MSVQKYVILESYSSSEGFIGYFERRNAFQQSNCQLAVELFWQLFSAHLSDFILFSSLHLSTELAHLEGEYTVCQNDIQQYIIPLIEAGLIQEVDYDSYGTDYDSPWYSEQLDLLWKKFKKKSTLSMVELQKIFYVVMAIDGVKGHCFCCFPSLKLIAYPHDDTGFGFVSYEPNPQRMQRTLQTHFTNENFVFHH